MQFLRGLVGSFLLMSKMRARLPWKMNFSE